MKEDLVEEVEISRSFPGEAWTRRKGSNPLERPPEEVDAEVFLKKIFKRLTHPKVGSKLLGLLKAKVPVDILASSLVISAAREGKIPATLIPIVAPSITVMMVRMADSAGIDFKISSDKDASDLDPSEIALGELLASGNELDKAVGANNKSQEFLSSISNRVV